MRKSIYYSIIYGMGTFVNVLAIQNITNFWVQIIYTCLSVAYIVYGLINVYKLLVKEENLT